MNFADGRILAPGECDTILEELPQRLLNTRMKKPPDPGTVLSACDSVMAALDWPLYQAEMTALGIHPSLAAEYLREAKQAFCSESLDRRLRIELGEDYRSPSVFTPPDRDYAVTRRLVPLGTVLHIAAGNADALPAFSVLEGLLTGNINILKLPAEEGGLSVRLLCELTQAEPALADYIYVFDYSSKDIKNIEKLIGAADAVSVFGGTEAVAALRRLVPPHIRLIEWGHRISFAYVTAAGMTDEGLRGLAVNMAATGQMLCSSLQGIYVDTGDMEEVYAFCRRFLPILESTVIEIGRNTDIGIASQVALQLYTQELEGIYRDIRVFRGGGCSLTAGPDRSLRPAVRFCNAWAAPLPADELFSALYGYKNVLQTAALLCGEHEYSRLSNALFRAGVVRICPGERMSASYIGEPRDGEYALRRYVKIVTDECARRQ